MTNPITRHLSITICNDSDEATAQGFDWGARKANEEVLPIEVKQVVVVRKGTKEGNPTVDFVLEDERGQRYVFMVTGRLLRQIPCGE